MPAFIRIIYLPPGLQGQALTYPVIKKGTVESSIDDGMSFSVSLSHQPLLQTADHDTTIGHGLHA